MYTSRSLLRCVWRRPALSSLIWSFQVSLSWCRCDSCVGKLMFFMPTLQWCSGTQLFLCLEKEETLFMLLYFCKGEQRMGFAKTKEIRWSIGSRHKPFWNYQKYKLKPFISMYSFDAIRRMGGWIPVTLSLIPRLPRTMQCVTYRAVLQAFPPHWWPCMGRWSLRWQHLQDALEPIKWMPVLIDHTSKEDVLHLRRRGGVQLDLTDGWIIHCKHLPCEVGMFFSVESCSETDCGFSACIICYCPAASMHKLGDAGALCFAIIASVLVFLQDQMTE